MSPANSIQPSGLSHHVLRLTATLKLFKDKDTHAHIPELDHCSQYRFAKWKHYSYFQVWIKSAALHASILESCWLESERSLESSLSTRSFRIDDLPFSASLPPQDVISLSSCYLLLFSSLTSTSHRSVRSGNVSHFLLHSWSMQREYSIASSEVEQS